MESAKNVEHTMESFYLLGFYEDKFHFAGSLGCMLKLCTYIQKHADEKREKKERKREKRGKRTQM